MIFGATGCTGFLRMPARRCFVVGSPATMHRPRYGARTLQKRYHRCLRTCRNRTASSSSTHICFAWVLLCFANMTDLGHNANCDYDLVIAGGGPAGSTAAIVAARRGLRVLLMERGGFPRHKVCGEFVSSESLSLLRDLLQDDDHALPNALPIKRFRVHVGSQVLEAPVNPPAAGISRYDLDATLIEAAQRSGADCRMQCEVLRCEHSAHFILQTSRGQVTARAVINASGRWSRLSSPQVVAGQQSFVGCKAHFVAEDVSANTGVELFFGRDGYCGVQPVWA